MMDAASSVIVLDSSDDEQKHPRREKSVIVIGDELQTARRITPQLISSDISDNAKRKKFGDDEDLSSGSSPPKKSSPNPKNLATFKKTNLIKLYEKSDAYLDENNSSDEAGVVTTDNVERSSKVEKTPVNDEFAKLIKICCSIDTSSDMEKLINNKLVAYYHAVHPDFVNSKSFCRSVSTITGEIKKNPDLIYLKLSNILQELKTRRKVKEIVVTNDESTGTGSARKDGQIWKLNKALYVLKKRIARLEETEVDFDDDLNSAHLKAERYKKRACQIYEKICDISGESKHAQRSVRKPIKFSGTSYPEFNRTLQTFVNRTNTFPDYFDVRKCLEHCNDKYRMELKSEEMKRIAQDAFIKVGKLLQKRRKTDLYETVSYFVGTEKDPADEDVELQEKLTHNKRFHTKISDLIDKYAKDQDGPKEGESSSSAQQPTKSRLLSSGGSTTTNHNKDGKSPQSSPAVVPNGSAQPPPEEDLINMISAELEESKEQLPPIENFDGENLSETVNMDETIEFVVSNNLDAFEDVEHVSNLLSEHDDLNLDI